MKGQATALVSKRGTPGVNGTYNQLFSIDSDQRVVEMSDKVPML